MLPDQLLIISVAAVVLVIIVAYGFGYHHGRVDGFQDGVGFYRKTTPASTPIRPWFKVAGRVGIRIKHPAVAVVKDRPFPAPGSPFASPPDVPSNPDYDEKGIKPDWP